MWYMPVCAVEELTPLILWCVRNPTLQAPNGEHRGWMCLITQGLFR